MRPVDIIVGSDIRPTSRDEAAFSSGDAAALFDDLLDDFNAADVVIVNLECALMDRPTPIPKAGPVLGASSSCINALQNTIERRVDAGIATVGAGTSLGEAARVLALEVEGVRVGILAMSEREFSIATETSWGVNPVDPIQFARNSASYRDDFDCFVVILHGGNEYHPYPSPGPRKLCRFVIEQGAEAVLVQHTHCPGSVECYLDRHIVCGQGNLIFAAQARANVV